MFRDKVMLIIVATLMTGCARLGESMLARSNAQAMEDLSLEERSVLSGDHRVSYFFREGISPVVLLHGFTADKTMFFGLIAELGDKRGLIVPDLPGHGATTGPETFTYTAEAMAHVVADVLREHDGGPFHVVGESMGGHVAGTLTLQDGGLVRSLTFIDATGWHGLEESEVDRAMAQGQNPFEVTNGEEFDSSWDWIMKAPPEMPGPVMRHLRNERISANHHVQAIKENYEAHRFSLDGRLGEISHPLQAVWCVDDRMTHVSQTEVLEQHTGASVTLLQGCNHVPPVEKPRETALALRTFWSGIDELNEVSPHGR